MSEEDELNKIRNQRIDNIKHSITPIFYPEPNRKKMYRLKRMEEVVKKLVAHYELLTKGDENILKLSTTAILVKQLEEILNEGN